MKQQLEQAVAQAVKEILDVDVTIELTRPEEKFGDYATNVALQLSKQLGRPPREIAEELAGRLRDSLKEQVSEVAIAGPGFINLRLTDEMLQAEVNRMLEPDNMYGKSDQYKGQTIVAEYSDPNPFKVLHAGHLYTSVVGDAIANLFEFAGGEVHRVNFGGDVGMHVGKTLWAILNWLAGDNTDKLVAIDTAGLDTIAPKERIEFLSKWYVEGNNKYEDDETAKAEMIKLNKLVYKIHEENDRESAVAKIYWTCRQWSYEYFDTFYARIGTKFEKYYPESETAGLGLETVKKHIPEVFEESNGAIVFKGEPYGLHTRVFINSEGLPTYEAKDVGLIMKKWQDYHFDRSIIITGNDQLQYMEVVVKAIEQFAPELAQSSIHLTHGIVKLEGGSKMSSRKGNILRAADVLDVAAEANKTATGKEDDVVVLGAVKYAFLKQRIGGDIVYDPGESVSLQGNSGPYLQYAHARARSILAKAAKQDLPRMAGYAFNDWERALVRKLTEYPEVAGQAVEEMMPHLIATYLYELAQTFNRFYENTRVVGAEQEIDRLTMVSAYAGILASGLNLLGIAAPESM
jgi:arginyl-tRNA synthetase